ncbi:hypothetical protein [Paraburkholderia bannensis]|uniref:hypothetical protein n=1 Tax=Paraburkholderia bannensis TaxID=765414 RepID=UPI002ABE9435|nr:hypothetical protein [Paraburkholderia bannensis]
MKNLYARFVLFLIRPAVQRALREESKQGGTTWRMRISGAPTPKQMASLGARIDTLASVSPTGGRL